MDHIRKEKRKEEDPLCQELQIYYREGIRLWLNGRPSNPRQIARACATGEECSYMRDYIRDEEDEVIGIAFDQVDQEETSFWKKPPYTDHS